MVSGARIYFISKNGEIPKVPTNLEGNAGLPYLQHAQEAPKFIMIHLVHNFLLNYIMNIQVH
jgi:hypothetical protein